MKILYNIKLSFLQLLIGFSSIFIFSQNICEEFEVVNLDFEPATEWGNLLWFDVEIPDTSIYAPYFFLTTNDEFIHVTDSVESYFWVTGPTVLDLLYHFDFDSIPENHPFSGNIFMISGDDILNCKLYINSGTN